MFPLAWTKHWTVPYLGMIYTGHKNCNIRDPGWKKLQILSNKMKLSPGWRETHDPQCSAAHHQRLHECRIITLEISWESVFFFIVVSDEYCNFAWNTPFSDMPTRVDDHNYLFGPRSDVFFQAVLQHTLYQQGP